MWRSTVLASLLAVACSAGSSRSGEASGAGGGEAGKPEPAVPAGEAIPAGPLTQCDPTGVWRARGSFEEVGDCADLPPSLELQVKVVQTGGGFRLVNLGEGELAPDRIDEVDGTCALGFELRADGVALFAHLLGSGASGRGIWERRGPGAACSQAVTLEVSRDARSAE